MSGEDVGGTVVEMTRHPLTDDFVVVPVPGIHLLVAPPELCRAADEEAAGAPRASLGGENPRAEQIGHLRNKTRYIEPGSVMDSARTL